MLKITDCKLFVARIVSNSFMICRAGVIEHVVVLTCRLHHCRQVLLHSTLHVLVLPECELCDHTTVGVELINRSANDVFLNRSSVTSIDFQRGFGSLNHFILVVCVYVHALCVLDGVSQ